MKWTQNIYIKTNTEAAREAMGKVRAAYKGKVVSIKSKTAQTIPSSGPS